MNHWFLHVGVGFNESVAGINWHNLIVRKWQLDFKFEKKRVFALAKQLIFWRFLERFSPFSVDIVRECDVRVCK